MTTQTARAAASAPVGDRSAAAGGARRGRLVATLALAAAGALAVAAPAVAEAPFAMSERVVDATSRQVVADDIDTIVAAADRVADETDFDLWTVYVDSFDGMDRYAWANDTAIDSDAPVNALVLAIAVDDGEFGFSVDQESGLSRADQVAVESAVERRVEQGDWAEASIAASDALLQLLTGAEPTNDPDDGGASSSGGIPVWVIGAGLGVLGAVGAGVAVSRRRRADPTAPTAPTAPIPDDPWADVSTDELGTRAGSALVALDNDVRSSANELAFAEAQFGLEATREFKAALDLARQQLGQAFTVQQRLNEASPTDDERRAGLVEILQLCQAADQGLDSQTEAMAQLRSLQERAPELLNELEQRANELAARVPAARDTLRQLGATHPASALTTVAKAPDQADALLASARQSVTEGRARVQADDRGTAAAYARTAEDALQQVGTLLDMVANAGRTLAEATQQLDGAIASLTADVADAGRLAPGDSTIAPALQRAQAAIQTGTAARSGGDPLAALSELAAAEQALDAALAPRREQEQVQARASGQVTTILARAENAVRQTSDYIETHRGAVAAAARTRLATASEALTRARGLQASAPQEALAAAATALESATSALQLAQNDVGRWRTASSGRDEYLGGSSGIDGGSLILGGILNEIVRGSRSRGYDPGPTWGGGSGSWAGSSGGWGSTGGRSSTPRAAGRSSSGGSSGRRVGSVSRSGGARRSTGGARRSSGGGRRR